MLRVCVFLIRSCNTVSISVTRVSAVVILMIQGYQSHHSSTIHSLWKIGFVTFPFVALTKPFSEETSRYLVELQTSTLALPVQDKLVGKKMRSRSTIWSIKLLHLHSHVKVVFNSQIFVEVISIFRFFVSLVHVWFLFQIHFEVRTKLEN